MAIQSPFVWGAGGAQLTPEEIAKRREIEDALLAQGVDTSPVGSAWEGLARVANAAAGSFRRGRLARAEADNKAYDTTALANLLNSGGAAPAASSPAAAAALPATQAGQEISSTAPYRDAIAAIESRGSGDYAAVGPANATMGRPLGRYQIMEANIGPWSKEALGREVSADEFLANPAIQDQIFDKKFGSYVQQYGPEGAAQAWFGGPGAVGKGDRRDVLGTSVAEYGNRFMAGLGQPAAATASDAIEAVAPLNGPATAYAPPLPAPRTVAAPPPVASAGPVEVAQAAPQVMAPNGAAIPPAIIQVLSDPRVSERTRGIAQILLKQNMDRQNALLEQQMKMADPAYQMGLEKDRLTLDQLRNPREPDSVRALRARADAAGLKAGTPEYNSFMLSGGEKGITINNEGNIPAGYQAVRDPQGRLLRYEPVAGSPAAAEAEAAAAKKAAASKLQTTKADVVTQDIDRALGVLGASGLPSAGVGEWLSGIPGTNAKQLSGLLDTVKANISFDTLNQMRQASPTGGALGSVTENELKLLQSAVGSLGQDQDPKTLKDNLNRVWNIYMDTVHGAGNGPERRKLSFDESLKEKPISEMSDEELKRLIDGD